MKPRPIEELKAIACKYKTKKEFRDNDYNAYASAQKRGLLNEVCEYANLEVLERRNVTDEEVIEAAKKYKTRKEFREQDGNNYAIVIRRKLGNIAFKHMEVVGNKYYRCIYAYEFPVYKVCYIGLTYDLHHRDLQHKNQIMYSAVREFAEKNQIEIPDPKQLTDYLPKDEAAKMECTYIQKYSSEGWTLLNRQDGGNLGGSRDNITYTKELCQKLAEDCKTRTEFAQKYQTAYKYTKLNQWDDYVFVHMESTSELLKKCREKAANVIKKAINMYNYKHELVANFHGLCDIEKQTILHTSTIRHMLNKKSKYFYKGYYFTYKDQDDLNYFKNLKLSPYDYKYGEYNKEGELIHLYKTAKELLEHTNMTPSSILRISFYRIQRSHGSYWKRIFVLEDPFKKEE